MTSKEYFFYLLSSRDKTLVSNSYIAKFGKAGTRSAFFKHRVKGEVVVWINECASQVLRR